MVPQEQNEISRFENMRKQVKIQSGDKSMQRQELYPERQKNRLQQFLKSFKQYPKITAVMLEHQLKSINTLPKQIKDKFPQLNERVERSIECCKKNTQFLQQVRSTLQSALHLNTKINIDPYTNKHQHQCKGQQQHSHSHAQYETNPNKILNIFNHLCRQYSQQQIHKEERYYIEFVKSRITQYMKQNAQMRENMKVLVVGCGMGRTLLELRQLFQKEKLPVSSYLVQGHQQDPEYYLLAQYLLNWLPTPQQKIQFHPYIHNFSNNIYQSTPYLPVSINIPQQVNSNKYGMTFGQFNKLYKSHSNQWTVIVSQFYNYSLSDILLHIQIIYKLLKNNGIWIDICTASFENHIIPYMSYQQYQKILDKTQFKLINKFSQNQFWYQQPHKLMKQWRKVYYRVMLKTQSL